MVGVLAMVFIGVLPFVIAAVAALLVEIGTPSHVGESVASSYQPMEILTHSTH